MAVAMQLTLVVAFTALACGFPQLEDETEIDLLVQLEKELLPLLDAQRNKRVQSTHEEPNEIKGMSTEEQMAAFKAPSKRMIQRLEMIEREGQKFDDKLDELARRSGVISPAELRELQTLKVQARALQDPLCSLVINCTEARVIIDGEEFRTANGSCNNLSNDTSTKYGMAMQQHQRWVENAYANGRWQPRVNSAINNSLTLPKERVISNTMHRHTTSTSTPKSQDLSQLFFQWGQFLDHDIIKTPEGDFSRKKKINCCNKKHERRAFCLPYTITAADNDPYFTDGVCMPFKRSHTVLRCDTGERHQNQINEITSCIDASNVYGSSTEEMDELRTFNGGWLKQDSGNMLPVGDDSSCNKTDSLIGCRKAGDLRVNVFPGLTDLHTIFVILHNQIAEKLGDENDWNDEKIFQKTRKIVGAIMQKLTYTDWLTVLMSGSQLSTYLVSSDYAYNQDINLDIYQAFSIAFRFGHSLLPETIGFSATDVANSDDVWNKPSYLWEHNYRGPQKLAVNMAATNCPMSDRFLAEAVQDKLFKSGNKTSIDLGLANIFRAREWGTPSYTTFRQWCNIENGTQTAPTANTAVDFSDLSTTMDAATIARLKTIYDDPRDVDLFTGLISETPESGSKIGKVLACLLGKQFSNLKHGDRFWYTGTTQAQIDTIDDVTFSQILCKTLGMVEIQENAFLTTSSMKQCSSYTDFDWSAFH